MSVIEHRILNTLHIKGTICRSSSSDNILHSNFSPKANGYPKQENKRRSQQWTLSTNAFHESFDNRNFHSPAIVLSNSCSDLNNSSQYQRKRRAAISSAVQSSGIIRSSNPPVRSPQSSFESNGDVGEISVKLMRFNGSITPFKTLLANDESIRPLSSSSFHLSHIGSSFRKPLPLTRKNVSCPHDANVSEIFDRESSRLAINDGE
ncbi:hypothetical protein AB6A40_001628 [Gnathostoma spinigerum]|uniref:Uncharacterized protein n=1 Tax=Gnathostoma spinigerum TaxID=75299 RepID=A0ABD6E9U7_9BILA